MTFHRHLPRAYFADAPTLPAPENLGRSEQSGAAARETAGESGAGDTLSPAVRSTVSSHISPPDTTGVSPELDKIPAPADDTATGRQGISRAQQLCAARIISGRQP